MAQRERHPDLHVYHYAPYEPSAMKRLMGSHHTREREVDELLRGEVFVDLYAVVRQGVRIGSESYSLKKVEQLYMERPPGEVMDGGGSIVAYEAYLDDHAQHRLDEIESYNEDDCRSTLGLRDWLEARRADAEAEFGAIPRPVPSERRGLRGAHRARGRARDARGPAHRGRAAAARRARPTSSRPAGCSRRCSSGTAARPSPTGGCTSTACA